MLHVLLVEVFSHLLKVFEILENSVLRFVHQDLDILFPDLVYDYYAAAWDGPQGRLEVFATMITMTMMVTMVTMIMLVMLVMMVMMVTMMMLRMLLW